MMVGGGGGRAEEGSSERGMVELSGKGRGREEMRAGMLASFWVGM
jgi:hypothetical protein